MYLPRPLFLAFIVPHRGGMGNRICATMLVVAPASRRACPGGVVCRVTQNRRDKPGGSLMIRTRFDRMSDAEINPFASPLASLVPEVVTDDEIWRDGDLLVVRKAVSLPDRCVKCNAPAEGVRLRRSLLWHHWSVYLTLLLAPWLIGILLYVVVSVIVRQRAEIDTGICRRHLARRRGAIAISWLTVLLSFGITIIGFSTFPRSDVAGIVALGCFLLFIAGSVYGVLASRILWPKKIDPFFAWLHGVCPEYLAELPEVPAAIRRARLGLSP